MDLQRITPIHSAEEYVAIAVRKSKKLQTSKPKGENRFKGIKAAWLSRIQAFSQKIQSDLHTIEDEFPDLDNLPELYIHLIDQEVGIDDLRKSLGAVGFAKRTISSAVHEASKKMRALDEENTTLPSSLMKQMNGRVRNVLEQISEQLEFLEKARKTLRKMPNVKTGIFTVCIVGFPNVGKSTLLGNVTEAKPKVDSYPFTSLHLNIGYTKLRARSVQFIDCPGTLNREKMNDVERQAHLAMRYSCDLMIYVYDLTETYPLQQQIDLFNNVQQPGKTAIYFSKEDVCADEIKKQSATLAKDLDSATSPEALLKLVESYMIKHKLS